MKRLVSGLVIFAAFIWGLWLVALPERLFLEMLDLGGAAGDSQISLEPRGFKKGLFYNFRIEELEIKRAGRRALVINGISGSIRPGLKISVPFSGTVEGGVLNGLLIVGKNQRRLTLNIVNAGISDILPGSRGTLNAEAFIDGNAGEVKFSITGAEIKPGSLYEIQIPVKFHTARGALVIAGDKLEVKSVSLEGERLYARLKGSYTGGADSTLELELMPEDPSDPVFAFAGRYKVAPGFYRIPLKKS